MKKLGKIVLGLLVLLVAVLAVAWFALQKPDAPYAELEKKYGGATSQYMGVPGGIRAHYRDQGNKDGPVLVMVHGFSASTDTWQPWVERLGFDYRIISLDLPGHGLTRAPEGYSPSIERFGDHVNTITERLGVGKFTLIGNSMGGNTAWAYALKYPDKLDGLVLVDAGGWPPEGEREAPLVFKILGNPVGRALVGRLDSTEMVRGGLRAAFEPTPGMVDDAMVARYVEMARAPGHRDIMFAMMSDRGRYALATPEKLAAIKTPTLIMQGDTDKLVPPGDARKFADAIPGSTLIMYEKTGHIPMEQIADKSALDLKAWLETKVYAGKTAEPAAKP